MQCGGCAGLPRKLPAFVFHALLSALSFRMLLRMCIKGGDLSHGLLSWESHLSWSYRAAAEFYAQGDLELAAGAFPRRLGLPVTGGLSSPEGLSSPVRPASFLAYLFCVSCTEIVRLSTSVGAVIAMILGWRVFPSLREPQSLESAEPWFVLPRLFGLPEWSGIEAAYVRGVVPLCGASRLSIYLA